MTKANKEDKKVDVLFIGAHQDDVEIPAGGTLLSLVDQGHKVEILDLSKRKGMYFQEEEDRANEAGQAAKVLGVRRSVIDLGMLRIKNNYENRLKVADFIRKKRPEIIVTHPKDHSHPDHLEAHQLVRDAIHYGFATAIKTANALWRIKKLYYFPPIYLNGLPKNAFLVDISPYFEQKMEAMKCYASQFLYHSHNGKFELNYIEALNRYLGLLIKKAYAEVIISEGVPVLEAFPELKS